MGPWHIVVNAGKFIVFEGIDGSGKSSTLDYVVKQLQARGMDVLQTREETDRTTGEWIRESIRKGADPKTTTFLFLADRAAHQSEIEAALELGTHVLCDRYMHSTLAYQNAALGGDAERWLRDLHAGWARVPDHVLLFDLAVETALERVHGRGQSAPYEKAEFLAKVAKNYAGMEDENVTRLDAGQSQDEVQQQALRLVLAWLA